VKFSRTWFDDAAAAALADTALRAAVREGSTTKLTARAAALQGVSDFEALRDLAARIKQHALENLDHYLEQFAGQVRQLGGHVHLARTAAEANACIAGIARDNGLRLCAKAKSMTSEEIGLNQALAAAGVRVVETDLGEFIVQLDHDRPSHIVTPIMHKNRRAVAAALSRALGLVAPEDPAALARHARGYLRDIFRRCDLGVTGVNFAVAETGTLCICTNEGNGRLTATRPRVHIALMGIEKIIPRLADLAVFLKVLARSATGQPITVYTSLINGPRRSGDPDGPEQLHVVILDAGRWAIQRSEYRDVLRCIRCGACLNACPVYRQIGGHAYGHVYPGPIGKLLAPLLGDAAHYADLPQASTLCGLCREVCPVRIDIPDLLIRLRRDQLRRRLVPWRRRAAFRALFTVLSSPRLLRLAQRAAYLLVGSGAEGAGGKRRPERAAAATATGTLPRPAPRSFRALWKQEQRRPIRTPGAPPGGRKHVPAPPAAAAFAPHQERLAGLPAPEAARRVPASADLLAVFLERARSVGLHARMCEPATLSRQIARVIGERAASSAAGLPKVIIEPGVPFRAELERALAGVAELPAPEAGDDALFGADVGITGVWAAVAETGSLVCCSGDRLWRSLSLVPPLHIAIVRAGQIVPDLLDLFTDRRPPDLPAAVTLISGPSKTADIEGVLVTGVHGPGEVHVFALPDLG